MIGFIPVLVLFCRMCGYDALVAVAIVVLAAGGSQSIGPVAPATTAIAQGFADLPIFSGIGYRLVLCAVFLALNAYFIVTYAMKVKKDPKNSLVYDLEENARKQGLDTSVDKKATITVRQILVLIVFLQVSLFRSTAASNLAGAIRRQQLRLYGLQLPVELSAV